MQGYIVNINRVKEEDLIVAIISTNSLDTVYRFYGARHGSINVGFKIDYEKERSAKSTIPRLKDVIHMGYSWINDKNLLRVWQDFVSLFHTHLRENEDIDPFYFKLLEDAQMKWDKQNPKRVAIESYVKLLRFEGRLHTQNICFLCSKPIEGDISLIRAYLPTHMQCSKNNIKIKQNGLKELYKNNSTLFMDDKEVEMLWNLLQEGL